MLVGNNSHYEYGIKMLKSDANLISSALSLSFTLNNSVPTNNQYFDFFPYLDKDDK